MTRQDPAHKSGDGAEAIMVILVDDHVMVRDGIKRLLQTSSRLRVVAEAASGSETLNALAHQAADLLIVDWSIPEPSGAKLLDEIAHCHPDLRVLVLTMHNDHRIARLAFQHGAHGFITKDAEPDDLIRAALDVACGEGYVPPSISAALRDVSEGSITDTVLVSVAELMKKIHSHGSAMLPIRGSSTMSHEVFLDLMRQTEGGKKDVPMKSITHSGIFSSRRIHDHVHWLKDQGWISLIRADEAVGSSADQRTLYIRCTEKLASAFENYAQMLGRLPSGA